MNNTAIKALEPGGVLWDSGKGSVTGLHLRAFPNGKAFYLYYRTKAGQQRRPKIGPLSAYTLAEAREHASEVLKQVSAGLDPQLVIKNRREALTVTQLCARYIRHALRDPKEKKKRRSVWEDLRQLKSYVRPRWGRQLATDISRDDVEALHKGMAKTPYQANRTLSLLSRMFNLAERWRVRESHSNPCRLVGRYQERRRRRFMTGSEAPVIASLLASYEAEYPQAVLFIYLLILTGARPDEIARGRRDMIQGDVLIHREHKTDSHSEERKIFLPSRVRALLAASPVTDGTLTGLISPRHLWRRVRQEAGCPDLRLYDLRRTFASAALRAGYNLDQIGELLGHTSGTTTKRYAWMMEELRSEATAKTANVLEGMMLPAPKDTPPS